MATAWQPPDAFDGVTAAHVASVHAAMDPDGHPVDRQSEGWVGELIGEVIGAPVGYRADRVGKGRTEEIAANAARVDVIIQKWIKEGVLLVGERKHPNRRGGAMQSVVRRGAGVGEVRGEF